MANGSVYTAQLLLVLCLLEFFKLKLDSHSCLPISEFPGYHCKQKILQTRGRGLI